MTEPDTNNHNQLELSPTVKKSVVDMVLDGLVSVTGSILSLLSGLLATVLVVYSGYVIADTLSIQERAKSVSWDLMQYKPVIIEDSGKVLASPTDIISDDYRAWLSIYDTNIDYPVMQGTNDLYYAAHDIYGHSSLTGAIYLAARNKPDFSDSYNLIYGHHMAGHIMFGSLDQYQDEEFFQSHKKGLIVTQSGVYEITIFAVAKTDAYEKRLYEVTAGAERVLDFLHDTSEAVGVGTHVLYYEDPLDPNRIIALSTCSGSATNGRFIIFGSLEKKNLLTIEVSDYVDYYDGNPHTLTIETNYPDGTVIHYSLDGGKTWSTEVPYMTDPCKTRILVRAENPVYGTAEAEGLIHIKSIVNPTIKVEWEDEGDEKRPPLIMTTLTGDGNIRTVTLSDENDWTAVIYHLPKYDDDGNLVPYTWTPINIDGYNRAHEYVKGETTTLVFMRNKDHDDGEEHTVTINYVYPNGTTAAESKTIKVRKGESFSVKSPSIPGYVPTKPVVSGKGEANDMTFTVVYVVPSNGGSGVYSAPAAQEKEEESMIKDIYVQKGICFE